MKNKFELLENEIDNLTGIPESMKNILKGNCKKLMNQKMNIMVTGGTGSGKSSTINAIFGTGKAKVGTSPDPETMDIQCYHYDNLVIWDTPGFGDGTEADRRHARNIVEKLHEKDSKGELLIDLVLVILDGASRDFGTAYDLINKTIIPNLGDNKEGRILIGINKCDMALSGRHWNQEKHLPDEELNKFLEQKEQSVKERIYESTGTKVEPVSFSAGFKEEGKEQEPSFNINKLLFYIISKAPEEKRFIPYAQRDQDRLKTDSQREGEKNWKEETKKVVE